MSTLAGAGGRALIAFALLTALFAAAGAAYSAAWCAPLATLLGLLQPDFAPVTVALARIDGQPAFQVTAVAAPALVARFPVMPAGTVWTAGTLEAYAHLHAVLIGTVLAAWPASGRRQRLWLLVTAPVAVATSTALDLPFALHGLLLAGVHELLEPGTAGAAAAYAGFLQRGGRWVLPLIAGVAAADLATRLAAWARGKAGPRPGPAAKARYARPRRPRNPASKPRAEPSSGSAAGTGTGVTWKSSA